MAKRKKFTVITIVESVLLLAFIAVAVIVALNLRPVTFTASDGTSVSGWSWAGKVFLDAGAFTNGMDTAVDIEGRTISYSEPVDPETVRSEAEEAMTLRHTDETNALKEAHEDAVSKLKEEVAAQQSTIEELEARIAELEGAQPAATAGSGGRSSGNGTSGGNSGGNSSSGGDSGNGSTPSGSSGGATPAPTPAAAAAPAPAPAPAPVAPSVDAAACIAAARAHALGLGMTEDGSLAISNSGYLNPADITVLTQENVISSLQYCLNQYHSYSPDDPSLVHFNIVQSGNLIYALYQ